VSVARETLAGFAAPTARRRGAATVTYFSAGRECRLMPKRFHVDTVPAIMRLLTSASNPDDE
jgi:hypothetical protein